MDPSGIVQSRQEHSPALSHSVPSAVSQEQLVHPNHYAPVQIENLFQNSNACYWNGGRRSWICFWNEVKGWNRLCCNCMVWLLILQLAPPNLLFQNCQQLWLRIKTTKWSWRVESLMEIGVVLILILFPLILVVEDERAFKKRTGRSTLWI